MRITVNSLEGFEGSGFVKVKASGDQELQNYYLGKVNLTFWVPKGDAIQYVPGTEIQFEVKPC